MNLMFYCLLLCQTVKQAIEMVHLQECLIHKHYDIYVGFEVFTAVTMKNVVFRDVALCGFFINRRFGGTCRLHLQGGRNNASEGKC
jgi:hypothetical protein